MDKNKGNILMYQEDAESQKLQGKSSICISFQKKFLSRKKNPLR